MNEISFSIEADPVPASRPRVTARGVAYYPKKHTLYAEFLKGKLNEVTSLKAEGPVEARFLFVMPRYKTSNHPVHRADVDNLTKLPMDSMTKSESEDGSCRFWVDDHMVVHLTALKRFARDGEEPHTKVRVIKIEGSVEDHVDQIFNS